MTILGHRALKSARRMVSRALVDEVEVRRMKWKNEVDEDTLVSNYDEGETIYTGPARVRPTAGQNETVGESVIHMRSAQFTLPHTAPQVRRDDVIRVMDSPNSDLIDRWFQVTEERIAGQEAYKRVETVSIAPSRQWIGGNVDEE